MRTITVLTLTGKHVLEFDQAVTWEIVERELNSRGVSTSSVEVVEFKTRTIINGYADTKLPEGDIILGFKTKEKSFGADYATMRAFLKTRSAEALASNDTETLKIIGNYPHKTIEQLEEAYNKLTTVSASTSVYNSVVENNEFETLKVEVSQIIDYLKEIKEDLKKVIDYLKEKFDFETCEEEEEDDNNGLTDEELNFLKSL